MSGPSDWSDWVEASCRSVEDAHQWRQPRIFDARGPVGRLTDFGAGANDPEAEIVSFASNDYLGLSCHPAVLAAAHRALDRWGAGSGASRLVTGSRPIHAELEATLAEWKGCDRAIVFPTGFAANLSVLSVFASHRASVFSDELNHASIIDGCRASSAEVTVYRHNDLGHLQQLVAASTRRPIIVSDTVFSMDGDAADLTGLVEIARRFGALLVLDEAHAVLGPELPARAGKVDVLRVGTLSKMLGSLGGFVAGPGRFVELLVNRARPYIFTTAPSPANAAAALAAVGIVRSPEGAARRRRLVELVTRVSDSVGVPGRPTPRSPIVPVIIGDEARALAASDHLLARGLWVPAIRPPTVPAGTSRLRVTLSSIHTDEQVDRLVTELSGLDAQDGRGGSGAKPVGIGSGLAT
ncbi:MAG: aminotransferase class I/II-fold pyridoxal phosphate-dependent enzyme [Acidimicrobiales bacterium]